MTKAHNKITKIMHLNENCKYKNKGSFKIWMNTLIVFIIILTPISLSPSETMNISAPSPPQLIKTVDNFLKCNSECATHRWVGYTNHL